MKECVKTIVEYLKNKVHQRQIAKILLISASTVHNIIKIFKETGEISVCKGQGRRLLLDAHGLRALRRHCITPACYQRSVQKPASLMVWRCIRAYIMGSLHVLEGTMNAERYIKVLEQHMLPSR